jgi:tetratricopeptide (TPR) repeat protein
MRTQRPSWAERAADLYRRGEFRSAAMAFRAGLLQTPSSHRLMVMFARSLEKVNPLSPFRHYARKATMLAPGNADAWRILADGAFNQREFDRATDAARRHSVLEPGALSGFLILSRARFMRGEFEQCQADLEHAAALAPEDKFVRMAQARCLFRLGRHADALRAAEMALERGAGLGEFGFDHCRIARAANRPDIAEPLLDNLETLDREYAGKRRILDLTVTVDDLRARRP